MSKKFTFNFKFLDRFKKKSKDSSDIDQNDEDDLNVEMREFRPQTEYNYEEEFSDPAKKEHIPPMTSEFETDESPEDFAEKTLSNFKVPNLESDYESNENESVTSEGEPTFEQEQAAFNEMHPPEKPNFAKHFGFSFSKLKKPAMPNLKSGNIRLKSPINKFEKMSWNEIVLKIFSPYSRGKIHNAFLVLLVISLTYLLGKTIALITNRTNKIDIHAKSTIFIPQDKQESSSSDISKITSANLFNVRETEEAKAQKPKVNIAEIVCVDADRPTTMQAKLLDTIVLQDSVKSVASVQVRGGADLLNIREGETLENAMEVSKILRMRLILKNLETGDCEYLSSDQEAQEKIAPPIKYVSPQAGKKLFVSKNTNIKNDGNTFKIKKAYRDQMITKMSDILTQARAVQITNPDGTLCFKMTEVVAGSIYNDLNIVEGDIICQINGRKIDNLNELMTMLGKIKEIDNMSIGLKRNGMSENLDYSFE
jgi:type II secretory pathway component PulC